MTQPQEGYLLIADITGYTIYLTESELEHAQGTLTTLLELLVEHTRPPLVISRLAGDAVISYGLRDRFYRAQTFMEMIEDTYVAFRRAIETMVLNNTCRCNACANVSMLDLKFFVHYGVFALQRIGGHDELVGSDVNLIHRLMKNSVAEATGITAYTLYTAAAARQLGIAAAAPGLVEHHETYDHLGEVQAWVQDMHPVWQAKRSATRLSIPPEDVFDRVQAETSLPPEIVWDYLAQTEFRLTLTGADRIEVHNPEGGRIGPGSVFQCYHGDKLIPETILEWQPFERMVTREVLMPNSYFLVELCLSPTPRGTLLEQVVGRPKGAWYARLIMNVMGRLSKEQPRENLQAFVAHIERDHASRLAG